MKAAVIVFPGSNCDRDVAVALGHATGEPPAMVWHRETELPPVDLIVLPGGFSYGDYLRAGAMSAHAPIMRAVIDRAHGGVSVLGICNGFQILTECGLLPGVLMRNSKLRFLCRDVHLKVGTTDTSFTNAYADKAVVKIPIAHNDGNYQADSETLDRLEGEGRVAFRYCEEDGTVGADSAPNGAARSIAGILNDKETVLGMMPHPERVAEAIHGGTDGRTLFEGLVGALS